MSVSRPGNPGPTRRLRVLVVDDDTRIRRGLREILELSDDVAVVGEAASLTEALDLDLLLQPDVVVVDVLLPLAADGLQVLAELARRRRPAIALSVDTALASGALAAGAHAFLGKRPDLIDAFLPAVRTAAAGKP